MGSLVGSMRFDEWYVNYGIPGKVLHIAMESAEPFTLIWDRPRIRNPGKGAGDSYVANDRGDESVDSRYNPVINT